MLKPSLEHDVGFEALIERGEQHEKMVLAEFRAEGIEIAEIASDSLETAAMETRHAVDAGVGLIYQGVLTEPGALGQPALLGRPDFLVRADLIPSPDGEPRPDGVHYEVVDAKLARTAKARAVLQTGFYTQLLANLLPAAPRWMHLFLGNGQRVSLKTAEFSAYERQTRRLLMDFIGDDEGQNPPAAPYPDPVEHCAICRWRHSCAARRRDDDDLSLVAGMTKRQVWALKQRGVSSRRGFAELKVLPELRRVKDSSLERAQLQARLQVASEDEGAIRYALLDPELDQLGELIPNRGLLALPEPVIGDMFFDIEGARYYSEDGKEFGLQYLFGLVDTADVDANNRARYTQIWSHDRQSEKHAFQELIDFVTERRRQNPRLHVYHYNHYEPTALDHLTELHETREQAVGRLMGRFATREDEVDDLFRLGAFVDLYRVVRQGLRAGVENYSIKRLEPLCGFKRSVSLSEATVHLINFEMALDDGTADAALVSRTVVAGYNEDDCRSARALRDWLEDRRLELTEQVGRYLPRPTIEEDVHAPEDPEVTRIRSALLSGIPEDLVQRTPEQGARSLMADLLDWHRREAKPAWWRYFYVRTLNDGELIYEPDAIGSLSGGEVVSNVKRSVIRRFSFPPQDHGFEDGDTAFDPATNRGWFVSSVDDETGVVELKIGRDYVGPLPTALVQGGPVSARVLAERLRELGDRIAREGVSGNDAATAILLRARPNGDGLESGALRRHGETSTAAALRLTRGLRGSYLPIQGPPGTGKTFTGAQQILDLVVSNRTVGITGPSHAVIHNLIGEVLRQGESETPPRIGQRADPDNPFLHRGAVGMSYDAIERSLRGGELSIAAGTLWMWARPQFQRSIDTLVVDEAGQMSLANILAVAGAATNIVLLGDPQQLAQPSQAIHPPGAGASPLEHVLEGRATMPLSSGLLIDRTRRLHPALCAYTSEMFYDGKLGGVDGLERQTVMTSGSLGGSGIRIHEVAHEGNTNQSSEEAAAVADIVDSLVGMQWTNQYGVTLPVTSAEILIVTPYNAQIHEIEDALGRAGHSGVRVGTVDKFQGREAPVVIYSMASSSADDAPRGMHFLYDLHRLNVATSRARAMAILVASPDVVRVYCKTPEQMRLVNALCRAWE